MMPLKNPQGAVRTLNDLNLSLISLSLSLSIYLSIYLSISLSLSLSLSLSIYLYHLSIYQTAGTTQHRPPIPLYPMPPKPDSSHVQHGM